MKHELIPKIRGLLIVLEQSKDADTCLYAIKEINVQLKVLFKVATYDKQQNIAGSKSPG